MRLGDVVDELHDEEGLADAGAPEQPDLTSASVRRKEADDFNARLQNGRRRVNFVVVYTAVVGCSVRSRGREVRVLVRVEEQWTARSTTPIVCHHL